MVKKTVSIIIPNYNGAKLLAKNMPKVLAATHNYPRNTEVIVVDDGSTDNSLEVLKKFPEVKVTIKKTNEGFSSACNLGAAKAGGEIIVLLNTDVCPQENFLDFLIPHFDDPNVFGVGCLDKSWEEGREINRGRGIGWFKNGFLLHSRGQTDKTNTLWLTGGASAYNQKIWQELGGFDEIFNPFYWEDIDLSYRAQKKGYTVLFEPKAVVHHRHEEGAIKKIYNNRQIKTIAYRNQFIFLWKNITDKDLVLQHLARLPIHLVKALARADSPFIIGLAKAVMKLPRLFYYRTTVYGSNTKCISDKNILAPYQDET